VSSSAIVCDDLDVSREDFDSLGDEFKNLSMEEAAGLLTKRLASRRWRLDNLYKVTDEGGEVWTFKMRYAQKLLFLGMWYCNVILKSRQHGITTEMCILELDTSLFNSNIHCAVIAHNKDDAKDFFTKKVKFAYDNLPNWLRNGMKGKQDAVGVLSFANGSSMRVTTSGRSGTYQMVHISEFGKMCAKFPAKAMEVITGTLNTIHPGHIVTIESTAEGREGRFFEMCQEAQKAQQEGRTLSELEFKFHFFGAHEKEENRVKIPVPIPKRLADYFYKVEAKLGIRLAQEFKWWYVSKEKTQGEFMYREHPLTPEEAFFQSIEGSYYSREMADLRRRKPISGITNVPYKEGILVNTYWDLGRNDFNAIWFVQMVGRELHIIDYYENSDESLLHYADYCGKLPYRYGKWVAPHDIKVHEYTTNKTRLVFARENGINFDVGPKVSKEMQRETVRRTLPLCFFDREKTEKGVNRLDNYRKQWNDKLGCWKNTPQEDDNTHGADAFALMSLMMPGIHNWAQGPATNPVEDIKHDKEQSKPDGWT
jgi:hypothetical protein